MKPRKKTSRPLAELPSEQSESEVFSEWLSLKGIKHHHGNDNMYSRSWKQRGNMKRAGFSRGYPDFTLIIPCVGLVFVEMKKQKTPPSAVKPEQIEWIGALNRLNGVQAQVCRGSGEAIEFIEQFI